MVGLQLFADGGKVRQEAGLAGSGNQDEAFWKQPLLALLIPFSGQRPTHAGLRRSLQVLMDSALRNRAGTRDLPLFEPHGMEPENRQELPHVLSLSGGSGATSTSSEGAFAAPPASAFKVS